MVFIDFEKIFSSVKHSAVRNSLFDSRTRKSLFDYQCKEIITTVGLLHGVVSKLV